MTIVWRGLTKGGPTFADQTAATTADRAMRTIAAMYDFLGIDVPSSPASVIGDLYSAFSCSFCDGLTPQACFPFFYHPRRRFDRLPRHQRSKSSSDPRFWQPLATCKFAFSASALAQMGGKHGYAAVDATPDATMQRSQGRSRYAFRPHRLQQKLLS